ncbi:pilus assembly protein [Dyella sp. A6]|uniref:pilus assembly protein n=1 Tax=Dyella aluminiiresistens TaxID=3069105 RepID=UPI002E7A2F8F|nr:PilC/PilY family type IV pilus protein [Dyella sp. A6]
MKTTSSLFQRSMRSLVRMAGVALLVGLYGAVYAPAAVAATTVTVDQQPLTLQPPIPPNVVLMLDDSGSMAWDYMPDACYLYGVSCAGTASGTNPINGQGTDYITSINNDAVIDANNNGVYYNPTVTYLAPPTAATGTNYPSYNDITNVPLNGYSTSGSWVNLTNYSNNDFNGEYYYQAKNIYYSTSNQQAVPWNKTFDNVVTSSGSTYADQVCINDFNTYHGIGSGPTFNGISKHGQNWVSGECVFQYPYSYTYSYFQYSTGLAAGPYTVNYVAPATQGCGTQSNCVLDTDTSGVAAPAGIAAGQNIANWFAYYHTRILMAKSGLLTAFSDVDPKFRIGFGSINNSAQQEIFDTGRTAQYNGKYIAEVWPFGDGTSGTQKNFFWNWVTSINPGGGTPLRYALDAVGQYYQSSQPWTTMSSDPTTDSNIACRQSYTILTTDGFWNSNYSGVGNVDGTQGATVDGPNGISYTYTPTSPYQDDNSNTLADVAMHYWETDLNPNLANEVPINTSDPAFWQHMTTFTMGLGFTPYGISPTGTTVQQIFDWADNPSPATAIANFGWPKPSANSLYNIADLVHTGVDGHGGFYSATNPQTFASGLLSALKNASTRTGSGASLAANSTQLTSGTVAYQAKYHTGVWTGELNALNIDSSTGAVTTTKWAAVTQLQKAASVSSTGVITYPTRDIVTFNPSASSGSQFVPFINSSSAPPALSATELAALGSSTTAQMDIVNYLRGDSTLEVSNKGIYRNRTSPQYGHIVLGDIVDSQPVYVGAPDPNEFENQTFTGTDSFYAWAVGTTDSSGNPVASAALQREPLVYVAANDGMLHAFDANTGDEKYAYLPGAVITAGVANLANPSYGSAGVPHEYYNDGELTVADVYLPNQPDPSGSYWHTILVGTTGRGPAEAIYALDVTDPSNITPLWERSAGDGQTNSNYIGQMVGKPVIAQVADGNWQVLIGNGYNSASGTAALLEFNLVTGALSVHATDSSTGNGLAAPVTWMDDASNGVSTEAYAGDLLGRVWEFPLAKTTGSGTASADLSSSGTEEFLATDSSGAAQPITSGMLAGRDPSTGNVWLFFGTGKYLTSGDLANNQVQSWYGLIVQAGTGTTIPKLPMTTLDGNLVQRYITYEQDGDPSATPPTLGARTVTPLPTPSDMTGKLGWYMNLQQPVTDSSGNVVSYNAQGERMVTPNQFQGNLLLGTTRIPVVTDICNPSGSGWVMAVNPFSGTNPTGAFFLNGGSGTVTLPNGTVEPVAGVGFSSLPNNPIFVGGDMLMSFDNGNTSSLMTSGSTGAMQRVSWQELINQ